MVMVTPPFRNASSRRRCASVSKLYSVVSKICGSGLNVILVPRFLVVPVTSSALDRIAAVVALLVDLAVAPDLQVERLRQRVHDRDADAVQTAGDLVAVVVELAAGVQHGQHDFRGRPAALVLIDGNAAAVVDDGHRVVDVDRDVDLIAVAGQRLVDRVVDDLVDEVMQARRAGRADVHRRPLAHGLEAFEDLDLVRAVVVRRRTHRCPLPLPDGAAAGVGQGSGFRFAASVEPAAADRRSVVRVVTFGVWYRCARVVRPVVLPHRR